MSMNKPIIGSVVLKDTPLNGFPILYCIKWHPKLPRFLGYKASGFLNS